MAQYRHLAALSLIAFLSLSTSVAQKGKAPQGAYRYPPNYQGDTFTGELLPSDDTRLILEYKGRSGSEIFTGTLEGPCMAHVKADPHQVKELHLSTIPNRTLVTAFYNPAGKGQPAKRNVVLAIRFDRWKGKDFTNPRRPLIPCSKPASHN